MSIGEFIFSGIAWGVIWALVYTAFEVFQENRSK